MDAKYHIFLFVECAILAVTLSSRAIDWLIRSCDSYANLIGWLRAAV